MNLEDHYNQIFEDRSASTNYFEPHKKTLIEIQKKYGLKKFYNEYDGVHLGYRIKKTDEGRGYDFLTVGFTGASDEGQMIYYGYAKLRIFIQIQFLDLILKELVPRLSKFKKCVRYRRVLKTYKSEEYSKIILVLKLIDDFFGLEKNPPMKKFGGVLVKRTPVDRFKCFLDDNQIPYEEVYLGE